LQRTISNERFFLHAYIGQQEERENEASLSQLRTGPAGAHRAARIPAPARVPDVWLLSVGMRDLPA
jgi:hypothetical protein